MSILEPEDLTGSYRSVVNVWETRLAEYTRLGGQDPGEEIKGLGVMHPWTCVREEATGVEWNENGHPTTNPLTDLKNYTDSSGRTSSSAKL